MKHHPHGRVALVRRYSPLTLLIALLVALLSPTLRLSAAHAEGEAGGVAINGSALVNPVWAESELIAYQVILDVTDSMSWDFAGHGTVGGLPQVEGDTQGGTDYQCTRYDPADPRPYNPTLCQLAGLAPWRHYQERRITFAKQTIANLIDKMGPQDSMSLIAFSNNTHSPENAAAYPAGG